MADEELRSKLFFLDTNTYMGKNFQFNSHDLKRLQTHLDEDDCHLLITDVNVQEVRRHLKRNAAKAVAAMKKLSKDAMILRNTPKLAWHSIFEKITAEQILNELEENFQTFLQNDHVEIVSTKDVDVTAVFDAYFSEKPPFATSGKKAEFPDAFVLHAINSVSLKRGHKLYVVSSDTDLKSFCAAAENLISIDSLERLLDLIINNSERLKEPAKFAEEVYKKLEQEIHGTIKERLQDAEYGLADDWEFEIEVNGTELESIEYLSRNLVDVSKEGSNYELSVKISVIADLSVADYSRSPWDPEDKYYPFLLRNKIVHRYIRTAPVSVEISFDDGIMENAEILSIEIDEIIDLSKAKVEEISYHEMDLSDEEI